MEVFGFESGALDALAPSVVLSREAYRCHVHDHGCRKVSEFSLGSLARVCVDERSVAGCRIPRRREQRFYLCDLDCEDLEEGVGAGSLRSRRRRF